VPSSRTTANAQAKAAGPAAEGLSEEILLVISAAIAAYLGKKAPIRQIRLLRSDAWAQQGRATIQASHALKCLA
jgi:methylmalonyl-CoA carboxyltransferase large subunit